MAPWPEPPRDQAKEYRNQERGGRQVKHDDGNSQAEPYRNENQENGGKQLQEAGCGPQEAPTESSPAQEKEKNAEN